MVDLIAKTPLAGLLPFAAGDTELTETSPRFITSIMPYKSKEKACAAALKKAHDLGLPVVGRTAGKAALRVIWTGRNQYFLVGSKAASTTLTKTAALSDQSDGWAVMELKGAKAADVLARICPIDTRSGVFKRGHTARSELAHMMAVVTRTHKGFEIMVMRSFAKTAVHHISDAMASVAAQNRVRRKRASSNHDE